MSRVTFTIGTGTKWNGKPICGDCVRTFTRQACRSVAQVFGGYTLTNAKGGWINPAGELVEEEAIVIMTLGKPEPAKEMAIHLRDLFGQECVVLTVERESAGLEVEFV